jgi:hypothetical protein
MVVSALAMPEEIYTRVQAGLVQTSKSVFPLVPSAVPHFSVLDYQLAESQILDRDLRQ